MKRHILFILIIGVCLSLHAQQKKDKCSEEEFRAKKEAYLCKQAGLTKEEAEKFFPVYYELQQQKREINGTAWNNAKKGKDSQATEEEYKDIIEGFIEAEEKKNELDKEYFKKYRQVLSCKKIYLILRAEIKFHRNMLKILQEQPDNKK